MNRRISFLLALCVFLLLIACTRNGKRDHSLLTNEKAQTSPARADTDEVATTDDQLSLEEEFNRFIERFSKDEHFQLQRIKFPIRVIVPDTGDQGMAPKEESIGKYEWEQLDLTYDSTYLSRPYDQYYQVVRFKDDTAVVEIRGINNGIYADYYFSKINDEWYLVTLYEASF